MLPEISMDSMRFAKIEAYKIFGDADEFAPPALVQLSEWNF